MHIRKISAIIKQALNDIAFGGTRLITLCKDVFSKKNIIWDLAKSDFRKKFVGSYFGIFWMFIQPVVTIFIYYCVFQLGFKATPPSDIRAPYVLWLIPGIVPWFFFNEAVLAGTGSLYDYHYLVKKVVFKVSILPVIKIVSCAFVHAIFVGIMFVVYLASGFLPHICWMQVIYYSACTFVLALGISFLTCSINVFFKDMGPLVNILLQFGMWITPIMWHYSMADAFLPLLKLNPFFYISEGYRESMLNHTWFWQRPQMTIYFWAVTAAIFLLGGKIFKKLKPHFADVL